jgi:hypothetical protein
MGIPIKILEQRPKILNSKSQIVLSHPSSNTNPLYFKTLYFFHVLSFFFFRDLHDYGCNQRRCKIHFELPRKFKDFKPYNILNVWSPSYLPYS